MKNVFELESVLSVGNEHKKFKFKNLQNKHTKILN